MKNPLTLAVIGTIVTVVAHSLAGTISNKFFRGLGQLASVLGTVALLGMMSADPQVASQAGQYYFIGIVVCVILGKLFGKSNKDA